MKLKWLLLVLLVSVFPSSLYSNTIYFPQVAFGGGYSTTFVIINTGSSPVSGRLNFYSQQGGSRADLAYNSTLPLEIPRATRCPTPGRSWWSGLNMPQAPARCRASRHSIFEPAAGFSQPAPACWVSKAITASWSPSTYRPRVQRVLPSATRHPRR